MSFCLVGSEMCIRDSLYSASPCLSPGSPSSHPPFLSHLCFCVCPSPSLSSVCFLYLSSSHMETDLACLSLSLFVARLCACVPFFSFLLSLSLSHTHTLCLCLTLSWSIARPSVFSVSQIVLLPYCKNRHTVSNCILPTLCLMSVSFFLSFSLSFSSLSLPP